MTTLTTLQEEATEQEPKKPEVHVKTAIIPDEVLVWRGRIAKTEDEKRLLTYNSGCCTTEDSWKACTWSPSISESRSRR